MSSGVLLVCFLFSYLSLEADLREEQRLMRVLERRGAGRAQPASRQPQQRKPSQAVLSVILFSSFFFLKKS